MKNSDITNKHILIPQELFTNILNSVPICAVDVIFFNKAMDKIALFKRENEPLKNIYFTTGGRLLKNEKIIDCAIRQAKKEAGIELDEEKLCFDGIIEEIHDSSAFDDVTYHAVSAIYHCIVEEDKFNPIFDEQHSCFKWLSVSDRNIHPLIKKRLEIVFKNNEKKF